MPQKAAEVTKLGPVDCATCGSPAKAEKRGVGYEVYPQRVGDCDLHKNPQKASCGFPMVVCRSGWRPTRESAIESWNVMQKYTQAVK